MARQRRSDPKPKKPPRAKKNVRDLKRNGLRNTLSDFLATSNFEPRLVWAKEAAWKNEGKITQGKLAGAVRQLRQLKRVIDLEDYILYPDINEAKGPVVTVDLTDHPDPDPLDPQVPSPIPRAIEKPDFTLMSYMVTVDYWRNHQKNSDLGPFNPNKPIKQEPVSADEDEDAADFQPKPQKRQKKDEKTPPKKTTPPRKKKTEKPKQKSPRNVKWNLKKIKEDINKNCDKNKSTDNIPPRDAAVIQDAIIEELKK